MLLKRLLHIIFVVVATMLLMYPYMGAFTEHWFFFPIGLLLLFGLEDVNLYVPWCAYMLLITSYLATPSGKISKWVLITLCMILVLNVIGCWTCPAIEGRTA